jgi:hypothetical protein
VRGRGRLVGEDRHAAGRDDDPVHPVGGDQASVDVGRAGRVDGGALLRDGRIGARVVGVAGLAEVLHLGLVVSAGVGVRAGAARGEADRHREAGGDGRQPVEARGTGAVRGGAKDRGHGRIVTVDAPGDHGEN